MYKLSMNKLIYFLIFLLMFAWFFPYVQIVKINFGTDLQPYALVFSAVAFFFLFQYRSLPMPKKYFILILQR